MNGGNSKGRGVFKDKEKPTEIRLSNITAAKGKQRHPERQQIPTITFNQGEGLRETSQEVYVNQ